MFQETIGPNAYATLGLGESPVSDNAPANATTAYFNWQAWQQAYPNLSNYLKTHPRVRRDVAAKIIRSRVHTRATAIATPQLNTTSLSGLGDDGSTLNLDFSNGYAGATDLTSGYAVGAPIDTSSSGFDWNTIFNPTTINTLLSQAGNIAKLELTPGGSYQVINPNGQSVTYTGTGQPTSTAFNLPGISSMSSSSGTLLLLGGGVLLAIVVMSMGKSN